MNDYDWGWLVGWLEGEGTFHCSIQKATATRKAYARLTVRAVSIDEPTIRRAQSIAGGRVYGPYKYDETRQPHWQWGISGREAATEFMQRIAPRMSPRRQAQIERALAQMEDHT